MCKVCDERMGHLAESPEFDRDTEDSNSEELQFKNKSTDL